MTQGAMKTSHDLNRRDAVKMVGAALTIPFAVTLSGREAVAASAPSQSAAIGAYLKIDSTNTVIISIGSTEMGQGILTGLAQLVAEELKLNWSQVKAVQADAFAGSPNPYANPLFNAQLTGGSTSMRGWYLPLRRAAAVARDMLLAAASQLYGGTWTLTTGGRVINGAGVIHNFSELASKAATLTPPAADSVSLTSNFTVIGKSVQRLDIKSKTDGSAIFGLDVKVAGMVYAAVVHCPTLGGTVLSAPTSASGASQVVNLGNAVAFVSTNTWSAMQAANSAASKITWTLPANLATRDSVALAAVANDLVSSTTATTHVYETAGSDPQPVVSGSSYKVDAIYDLPFLAHACMEVLNCTANVTASSCEVWAPTQGQQFLIPAIAAATKLAQANITVHTTFLGGGLGRKFESDFVLQAVLVSKAVGKPVKLTWSRSQDFQNDKYRPSAKIRVQMGCNSSGEIGGLVYRNVSPSINIQRNSTPGNNPEDTGAVAGAKDLPYTIANKRIEFVPLPTDIPLGYWRSVGESYNTFAFESAIDELAIASGRDPLAFRRAALANDSRALAVINGVETLSGWSSTALPAGTGKGMAFLKGFGSYIALVLHVTGTAAAIKVTKAFYAIDCGQIVNPNSVQAQLQGGLVHGLSATLWGQVLFNNGVPQVSNFSNYRMLRMGEMPVVSSSLISSNQAPGGVGETPVPVVAPALANAIFNLTGTRLRNLPLYPGARMGEGDDGESGD